MDKNRLKDIEKKINELKIINYSEKELESNSNFLKIIKGNYYLNNGHNITREKVIKNIGNSNAVVIFAITKENKILVVIEPRTSLPNNDKVNIELPAGYIENNENPTDTAKRELEEETGYTSNKIILLDTYFPSLGASSERIDLFIAFNCVHNSKQHLDFDEYVNYEEVTFDEFKHLLDNNYIKDANSRIGYYRAIEYINKVGDIKNEN